MRENWYKWLCIKYTFILADRHTRAYTHTRIHTHTHTHPESIPWLTPRWPANQRCSRMKPGARNFIWLFHVCGRVSHAEAIFYFPG